MIIEIIPEDEIPHIKNLLRWLIKEVLSAGGDGDSILITEHYSIAAFVPILEEMNKTEWNDWWTITMTVGHEWFGTYLSLHHDQEALIITNEPDFPAPDWSQCTIRW